MVCSMHSPPRRLHQHLFRRTAAGSREPHRGRRGAVHVASALALSLLFPVLAHPAPGDPAREATLLGRLNASDLVMRGRVLRVEPGSVVGSRRAVVRVLRVIRGEADPNGVEPVVEELVYPYDPPSLHAGEEALLFLRDLPPQSRWRGERDRGVRYLTTSRERGVWQGDPATLHARERFLEAYLGHTGAAGPEAAGRRAEFLVRSLSESDHAIQEAAAAALSRPSPRTGPLGPAQEEVLWTFVQETGNSLRARGWILETLAGCPGFEKRLLALLHRAPELRPAALPLLDPSRVGEREVLGAASLCLEDPDPGVREGALRLLAGLPADAATARIGETALEGVDPDLRARAMALLADRPGEARLDVLARGLRDPDPVVVFRAADGLRRSGAARAARDLGTLLDAENPKARFVGILVLGAMPGEAAREVLRDAARHHPDPEVRALCEKTLATPGIPAGSLEGVLGITP